MSPRTARSRWPSRRPRSPRLRGHARLISPPPRVRRSGGLGTVCGRRRTHPLGEETSSIGSPLGRTRAVELPAASAFRGRDLAAMGCRRMSELGFWPNGRRTSNRDALRAVTAPGDGLETPRGRISHPVSEDPSSRGPRLGPSSSDQTHLPAAPTKEGREKTGR